MPTYSYSKTAGIVKVTVGGPGSSLKPGSYAIAAYGAAGGGTSAGANYPGGAGAAIVGGFTLQQNEVLKIVAGGMGGYGTYAGGGGGGSFVLADVDASGQLTPGSYRLLLAGGGGGGGSFNGVNPPFTKGTGASGGAGSTAAGDGSGGAGGAFASNSGGGGSGYKGGGGAGDAGGGSNRNGGVAYSGGTGAGFYGASVAVRARSALAVTPTLVAAAVVVTLAGPAVLSVAAVAAARSTGAPSSERSPAPTPVPARWYSPPYASPPARAFACGTTAQPPTRRFCACRPDLASRQVRTAGLDGALRLSRTTPYRRGASPRFVRSGDGASAAPRLGAT